MENVQTAVVLTFALAVIFFVPALMWVTLIAGLYRFVQDKVREKRSRRKRPPLPTRVGW